MRILHVGNAHLVPALRALGHEVIDAFATHPEVASPGVPFDAAALWARLPAPADLFLVADMLGPQALPFGLDAIPVPRVYYAVDIHVNAFWQRHYARLFDLVFLAQKDWVPILARDGMPAHWLPWGIDETVFHERGLRRRHDVCFVGVVDPALRPKRAAALAHLGERFRVVTFGDGPETRLDWETMAVELASSRIVFNEAIMGDLNFRVFEAMACGALLVTERIGNGLEDLFTPGEHLVVYEPGDLAAQVARYLDDEPARARIAAAGTRLVHARHTMRARMAELIARVEAGVARRPTPTATFDWGMTAHLTAVRGLAAAAETTPLATMSLRRALDEGHAEAAVALAEILVWSGRADAALDVLAEARELDPGLLRAWLVAAELEQKRGRHEAAATLLRAGAAAAAGPSAATRRLALDAITRGVATAECRHALGLLLQESGLPFSAGFVCRLDAGLPRTALDYFAAALELDPGYRPAAESGARLLDFLDLPDFALQFFEALVQIAPQEPAARVEWARVLRRSHRHRDADHQTRVAAALAGGVPDGDAAEQAAANSDAAVGLAEWALVRLAAEDWNGARAVLERAVPLARDERGALAELLTLVRARATDGSNSRPARSTG